VIGRVVSGIASKALELGATGGLDKAQYIDKFFAEYQFLQSLLAILIQLFLVSRIFKWVGIGGALLFLPFIALGGYGIIAFGATLVLLKWVKSLENGTDYSLMKTTMAALFLKTSREEKYKAKAAIDTFFWRGGDTLSAFAVFLGTTYLAASVESYAGLNVVCVLAWIVLSLMIAREYKKIKAPEQGR
jgi:AAA family ATP:ADP antiporter